MMQIRVAGQGGVKENQPGMGLQGGGVEVARLTCSHARSASQLQRGEVEFKTPGKTFFLGLNIV